MVWAASAMTLLASLVFLRLMKTMPPSQQIRPTVPQCSQPLTSNRRPRKYFTWRTKTRIILGEKSFVIVLHKY
ncbi:hypothetical protein EYF80_059271 [Liparis tanakae]|uniref:Secreted protein n=1 Tax=Liparis tanakae TaxID=230148 RepID=A0A4Z2EQC4_9TELE|nr:hypothetical protein EYF80_059271 [Liparis tanakae]